MNGPHPAVAAIRRAVRQALPVDGAVFVACSGGADSLALAAAVAFEAPRAGVAAGLITVDHGLQPGSRQQAERVATVGYELGLDPVHLVAVTVDPTNPGGPEAAARAARYAALDAIAGTSGVIPPVSGGLTPEVRDGATVLLGHTLDDQAETVLLGLGRGSGPRSIAGMRPSAGRYRRPLLGLRRATTVAACAALGLEPWDDPHNADPRYQRVRLRRDVLPLLEDVLQGGVVEALGRTASQLQADLDALERAASVHPPERDWPGPLAVASVASLDAAIRTRVLRDWLLASRVPAGELGATHLAAVEALITGWRGQGPIQLPGDLEAVRASGTLCLRDRER